MAREGELACTCTAAFLNGRPLEVAQIFHLILALASSAFKVQPSIIGE